MARAKKGTITIDSRNGILRLRLPRTWFNGKLKWFNLHLPDTPQNRLIAEAKVGIMQSDYIYERFDFTLEKYRFESAPEQPVLSLVEVFTQYIEFKQKVLARSSMKNLITVHYKLSEMPENVLNSPKNVKSWLLEHNTQDAARRSMNQIIACCDWAIEQELIENNPFKELKRIKFISKEEDPDPFTIEEREIIINAFEKFDRHYLNFVKFLFFTGCRPSEAAGLKWENVDLLNGNIIFLEATVEGHRKDDTKTHKKRLFPINQQLKEILENQPNLMETVFFSEKKKDINLNNFARRDWNDIFKQIPVRKRGCYHCRHTFITLCLDNGISIQQVAKWVGNTPQMILKHYAGLLGRSDVPIL